MSAEERGGEAPTGQAELLEEVKAIRTRLDEYIAFMKKQAEEVAEKYARPPQRPDRETSRVAVNTERLARQNEQVLERLARITIGVRMIHQSLAYFSNIAGRYVEQITRSVSLTGDVFVASLAGYNETMASLMQTYYQTMVVRVPEAIAAGVNTITGGLGGVALAVSTVGFGLMMQVMSIVSTLAGLAKGFRQFRDDIRQLRSILGPVVRAITRPLRGILRYLWMIVVLLRTRLLGKLLGKTTSAAKTVTSTVGGAAAGGVASTAAEVATGAGAIMAGFVGGEELAVRLGGGRSRIQQGMENARRFYENLGRTGGVLSRFYDIAGGLIELGESLYERGQNLPPVIGHIVRGFGLLVGLAGLVAGGFTRTIEAVGSAVKNVLSLSSVLGGLRTMASAVKRVFGAVKDKLSGLVTAIEAAPSRIAGAISGLVHGFEGLGSRIVDAIVDLIREAAEALKRKVEDWKPSVHINISNPLDWLP